MAQQRLFPNSYPGRQVQNVWLDKRISSCNWSNSDFSIYDTTYCIIYTNVYTTINTVVTVIMFMASFRGHNDAAQREVYWFEPLLDRGSSSVEFACFLHVCVRFIHILRFLPQAKVWVREWKCVWLATWTAVVPVWTRSDGWAILSLGSPTSFQPQGVLGN